MAALITFYSRAGENYFGGAYRRIAVGNTERAAELLAGLAGAGQIGMAIARRMGAGMKIIVGDKKLENAKAIAKTMNEAGFDVVPVEMDLPSRDSIRDLIAEGQKYGEIKMLVNAAGVSPSQAPIEAILKVDLYGTAVLLEEAGKVIATGGVGVTISSQSGWRMPALTAEQDLLLATIPTEKLLSLDFLQPENIRDTLHAYQLAKRCNEKRVMAQAVEWGRRGARLNDIAPPASSSRRWRWTSSTALAVTSTRICSPSAPQAVPAQRTRSPMWQSFS